MFAKIYRNVWWSLGGQDTFTNSFVGLIFELNHKTQARKTFNLAHLFIKWNSYVKKETADVRQISLYCGNLRPYVQLEQVVQRQALGENLLSVEWLRNGPFHLLLGVGGGEDDFWANVFFLWSIFGKNISAPFSHTFSLQRFCMQIIFFAWFDRAICFPNFSTPPPPPHSHTYTQNKMVRSN